MGLISFFSSGVAHAQTAILYFSPSSGSFAQGESFWTSIMVNTGGETVNAIGAYLSYPQDKLEPLGVSTEGSIMTIWAEKNATAGKIEISGGLPTPGFYGVRKVADIGFRVKASSGSINLKFNENSVILTDVGNKNIVDLSASGEGKYAIELKTTAPASAAPIVPAVSTSSASDTDHQVENGVSNKESINPPQILSRIFSLLDNLSLSVAVTFVLLGLSAFLIVVILKQ